MAPLTNISSFHMLSSRSFGTDPPRCSTINQQPFAYPELGNPPTPSCFKSDVLIYIVNHTETITCSGFPQTQEFMLISGR